VNEVNKNADIVEMYIFETAGQIELLETIALDSERTNGYSENTVNEIFRIMHTIKGSSAMMMYGGIASLAHHMEDLFSLIRSRPGGSVDNEGISDLLLDCVDFIKIELEKVKNQDTVDGDSATLVGQIRELIHQLQQDDGTIVHPSEAGDTATLKSYRALVFYEADCEMENVRAIALIRRIQDEEISAEVSHVPEDLKDHETSSRKIREDGLSLTFQTLKTYQEIYDVFMKTSCVQDFELQEVESQPILTAPGQELKAEPGKEPADTASSPHQSMLSVYVHKLDELMDLVGEMVIAEAMVTQNPEVARLELESFQKASRLLHKITGELQDLVMSIRMVPIASTFQKMQRIVRDMGKKLGKDIRLNILGEETEVDKNIIEHISDPLMHLVRNAIDHGIESGEDRAAKGKPEFGTLTLEARTAGSEVQIIVTDDGRGLNKSHILNKALEKQLIGKIDGEMSDKDIFNLILLPGFSTKENVTEYSGRGVGMDVVTKNVNSIRGSISVESTEGTGTAITMKIPLTLAIIDGMNVKVGDSCYTLPTVAIRESFRPARQDIINDPEGNEMIIVRGQCLPILRLHDLYKVDTDIRHVHEGILVILEEGEEAICVFADALIGQQQVVVKALPDYIKNTRNIRGLAGCTLLGDGSISLILDVGGLMNERLAA
jgi:two-component system, chemotaxis family, sensor kinase CheA